MLRFEFLCGFKMKSRIITRDAVVCCYRYTLLLLTKMHTALLGPLIKQKLTRNFRLYHWIGFARFSAADKRGIGWKLLENWVWRTLGYLRTKMLIHSRSITSALSKYLNVDFAEIRLLSASNIDYRVYTYDTWTWSQIQYLREGGQIFIKQGQFSQYHTLTYYIRFWKSHQNHQNPSNSIKACQDPSNSIKTHQIHQNPSKSIKAHQSPSKSIKIHQNSSKSIKIHQSLSRSIKFHQNSSKNGKMFLKLNEFKSRLSN